MSFWKKFLVINSFYVFFVGFSSLLINQILLESGIQQSPELLVIGLASIKVTNPVHQEYLSKLLLAFFAGHPNSVFVISRLWMISQPLIVNGLAQLYNKDHGLISRILDIAQDVKVIILFLLCFHHRLTSLRFPSMYRV